MNCNLKMKKAFVLAYCSYQKLADTWTATLMKSACRQHVDYKMSVLSCSSAALVLAAVPELAAVDLIGTIAAESLIV